MYKPYIVFAHDDAAETIKRIVGGGPRVVVSTYAFHSRVWGSFPGLCGLKETNMFLLQPLVKLGWNFESCVQKAVSSHHPQEVLLAQFTLDVHKKWPKG